MDSVGNNFSAPWCTRVGDGCSGVAIEVVRVNGVDGMGASEKGRVLFGRTDEHVARDWSPQWVGCIRIYGVR